MRCAALESHGILWSVAVAGAGHRMEAFGQEQEDPEQVRGRAA